MSDSHNEYNEHQKRFDERKIIDVKHPYLDHIELYLGLINPEYCAEIQQSLIDAALNENVSGYSAKDSGVKFVWQTTDDLCDTVNGERVPNILAAKTLYGSLEEVMVKVYNLNLRGVNICIAVNEIEGSRRLNENVTKARAIWLEDDEVHNKPRSPSEFPLPYSFVVETSSGKFHYYWLTQTEDLRTWKRIQHEVMVPLYKSDPGANGLNRAMRIPGFWHKKKNKFATRIVFILGKDNIPLDADPSKEFLKTAVPVGGKVEYAFNSEDCNDVIRYDWEEIVETFGQYLSNEATVETTGQNLAVFDPVETMHKVMAAEDYHSSLHALCMHFANYQQDDEYVTAVVQSILCRVPETHRDQRWNSRFTDVKRSAKAAVNKKIEELARSTVVETLAPGADIDKDLSLHSTNWTIPFPNIATGACVPLDMLMQEFTNVIHKPIKSFNFATILSFFSALSQNIPVMPAMGERKANGCHLLLAPSTGGKDINMSGPLKALARGLIQGNYISATDLRSNAIMNSFQFMNSEITSLTAFHKWAEDDMRTYGSVWSNTECTSIINKMSDENSNISNLAELVINIQDGVPIPVSHKASAKKDDEGNSGRPLTESYTLLFATQPASVKKHMNSKLLYKGVIGRFDYYIPSEVYDNEYESTLSVDNLKPYSFSNELKKFLGYALTVCSAHVIKTAKDSMDASSRDIVIKFDADDPDPRARDFDSQMRINGSNRLKHINWDTATGPKFRSDDPDYNIFINRVPMSTERYLTILTFMQHLWVCYKAGVDPFLRPIVATPELIELVTTLGDYQYNVRSSRIWSLISRSKGLDDKHQAMLDAIKEADGHPDRWQKYLTQHSAHVHKHLFDSEHFMSISSVSRCLTRDSDISTRDAIQICKSLADFGYVEFVGLRKIDVRISDRPVKNVVRLTQQGRS